MKIREHVSLKALNTFGVDTEARFFTHLDSPEDLDVLFRTGLLRDKPIFILGGGSNVLFTKPFDGVVLHPRFKRFQIQEVDEDQVWVQLGSGLDWHSCVQKTLEQGLSGLENLSLIPGTVGAAPIQNIGAYGVELQDVFRELEAVNLRTGETRRFTRSDCQFGYRSSWFKTQPDPFLILSVTLALSKKFRPRLSYQGLTEELQQSGITDPTPQEVSAAVIRIRKRKLPDPARLGSAGSFFKNPIIPDDQFQLLKKSHPALSGHPTGKGQVKLSAARLIDLAGWKGKTLGRAGVYKRHALILVNLGGATGMEIAGLAEKIREDIHQKFGISLIPEVQIL
ncbi:MAG: UDP-N-acetylmuramate dehydrogenase [FCB group bacterium]|nr:UDP-N-acetylmuramate dehydrogenase [FCB group bacterium]